MLEAIRRWTPDNRRFVAAGLALTIGAQLLVLAAEYLGSVWPLWFGTPVMLETAPIDPRSLFRGNYVRLNYDISTLDEALAKGTFKRGETAYVTLRREGELHVASGLQRERPAAGPFIRGRVERDGGGYRLRYGIEAFFMPKEKALKAEGAVRDGARAEVYLLGNGKAAIARLICGAGDC
jgi:uncharacterized membrane-anchored protein